MLYPETKLIVFARTPETGRVKTRLIPVLGETGATEFYRRMLQHTINSLAKARLCNMRIDCLPDTQHGVFTDLQQRHKLELYRQMGESLGERMANSLRSALSQYQQAIIIGTDVPSLTPAYIRQAIEALSGDVDVVLGPAQDGGYVLIGMKHYDKALFKGVDWGTEQVLQQTLDRAQNQNLQVHLLPALWDVDEPTDLDKIRQDPQLKHLLDKLEIRHEPEKP